MIKAHELSLRALEKSDLLFLHKLVNNVRSTNYYFEEPFDTRRELEDLYEKHIHNQTERRFVVEEMETATSIGVLSLIEIDEINRRCELDMLLDEQFSNPRYSKTALVLGLKYAFDILNLFKVYIHLLPDNRAGVEIYRAAGFKRECRLKKEVFINGYYVDVDRMNIFKNQWRRNKPALQTEIGFE